MGWSLLATFTLALFAPFLYRLLGRATGWVLAFLPFTLVAFFGLHLPISPGARFLTSWSWVPSLGVDLSFALDGLSLTFVLLVSGIGALVLIYSGAYLGEQPSGGRFFAYLLFFMGSMLGLVLSDNVITLFVFWELTSISSYLLIGFHHHTETSRASALKALLVTGAGGLLLLAGLLLMMLAAVQLGSPLEDAGRISALFSVDFRQHPLYLPILVLLLLGAFTKSAQVPFHFWLPAAMAAPTPVSAYLHSATMVKAGVYLLARFHPILGGTIQWETLLIGVGVVTMLVGAIMATGQRDLKRILAYSTISVLGILTTLLGVGTVLAVEAAVVFLVAHALYKAALFMVAGNIDHETGTRDVTRLGGLRSLMPVTAITGILASLSKAGTPPMFGFIGKEALYTAKLDIEILGLWLIIGAVLANVLLVAMSLVVAIWPFFGSLRETPKPPHEAPISMLLGPVLLAGLGMFVGIIPGAFDQSIGSAMATAILGFPVEMKLKLWHGFSPASVLVMVLSGITLATGFLLFKKLRPWFTHTLELVCRLEPWMPGIRRAWQEGRLLHELTCRLEPLGPTRAYERLLAGLTRSAQGITRLIQSGYLRHYILIIILAAVGLVSYPLLHSIQPQLSENAWKIRPHEAVVALLTLAGAIATVRARYRLTGVAALGVTGLGIALIFVIFGAPDLAITQVMVETLTVILFVLVFYHLPPFVPRSTRRQRFRDLAVSITAGLVMTLVVLATASIHLEPVLTDFYSRQSLSAAYGRNIVNVILVDFRALDTLGEITVLAVAGFGVYALLRLKAAHRGEVEK
ncbi:MAG: proton-conducting transporter membrane subunit [Syntrophobacterales bacterium]|jgi:multicomponent Na+:H+ antiporter subunit A